MSEDNCPGVVWLVAAKRPCAAPLAPSTYSFDSPSICEKVTMRNCLIWTFVGIAIAGGRNRRFSNHDHFDVRIQGKFIHFLIRNVRLELNEPKHKR